MKKFFTILFLFVAMLATGQDTYWTNYSFIVEPENESTVVKLIDDYFKENKFEGVTVTLYANHFHDQDNAQTHVIGFSGSLDAMGAMYASPGGDAWDLLGARLDHFIEDGAGARMGTVKKYYGDTEGDYPIQRYYIVDAEDAGAFSASMDKFMEEQPPKGVVVWGNVTSGVSPEGENHWVLVGYKDFKGAMGGATAGLSDDQKDARNASWKTFDETNGGMRMVRSGLRVRVGKW
jgi:hypothetical protein